MYHNILIPVAYEPGFDLAKEVEVAKTLAAPSARMTLLHVMEPVPFFAIDYMPEGWREELIEAIKVDMGNQLSGADACVVEGGAGHSILDWANAEGVDCIVLSSHRSDSSLFGSTASWIARHAPCAVHLIR